MCTVHCAGTSQLPPSIGRLWLCLDPTHPIIHYSLRPKIFFGLGFPYPLFGCCPPAPLLQGVSVFVIFSLIYYLAVALMPFYCKVDEDEDGELPLHEQGKEKVQNGATDSSKPLTLFQSPPGILRF